MLVPSNPLPILASAFPEAPYNGRRLEQRSYVINHLEQLGYIHKL